MEGGVIQMNDYEILMRTAQVLRTVSVAGDYWAAMQACVNSILQVAEKLKGGNADGINNKADA
jgi:hypothetical protein